MTLQAAIQIIRNTAPSLRALKYRAWRRQQYFSEDIIQKIEQAYPPTIESPKKIVDNKQQEAMRLLAQGIDPLYKRPCCGGS